MMQRFFDYLSQSRAELARVSWPTRRQAVRLTLVVIMFSVVVAGIIGGLDYVFSQILKKVILKG